MTLSISGWQPRWFILNGGVLSYYLTSSDVQLGSKSSLNVSSCDIIGKICTCCVPSYDTVSLAHSKDNQRIDLVIKGGRRIYLRANSQSERQKWLIALGYVKQQETHVETCKFNFLKTPNRLNLLFSFTRRRYH